MKVSNCCGVRPTYTIYEQRELCPKCGEHCEYIEEETQKTALMELISELHQWAADKYCLYSEEQIKVVRDVINRATELLQKERKQIEESFDDGFYSGKNRNYQTLADNGTDYYNKTYKA